MRKKSNRTTIIMPLATIGVLLVVWQVISMAELIPSFMLPSPVDMIKAFISEFPLLMYHAGVTLFEAIIGLLIGCLLGFFAAVMMDAFFRVKASLYPIAVITQTIPTVAIAPLLILWLGYASAPKIVLVVITSFFPLAVSLLDGLAGVDRDEVNLLRSMGANRAQIFVHLKIPATLGNFFSGLRISTTYSIIGAVVAEWVGGYAGLGVYMMRVKKSYSYDKMFAVILLIVILSLLLILILKKLEKKFTPYL